MLVVLELTGGDQLVREPSRLLRGRPALLRAERERVLVLAAHAPALGDVLARLAHRLARVPLFVAGVREPPAERRVVDRPVAARVRGVRLCGDEGRTGHRLDASGDEQVTVPGHHRVTGTDDGGQPGGAQPVDRHSRDGLRKPGEQRGEARHVAVVLAGLVRAAEPDVLDLGRGDAGTLDRGRDGDRREVVGTHPCEPAAVAAHRSPDGREDDGARHVPPASSVSASTRCAIANAPFAAGTPQ
jgi:hypothetical protein